MTLFAVTIAERPPDADHQYGHGKIENLSAFLETLLLVAHLRLDHLGSH